MQLWSMINEQGKQVKYCRQLGGAEEGDFGDNQGEKLWKSKGIWANTSVQVYFQKGNYLVKRSFVCSQSWIFWCSRSGVRWLINISFDLKIIIELIIVKYQVYLSWASLIIKTKFIFLVNFIIVMIKFIIMTKFIVMTNFN